MGKGGIRDKEVLYYLGFFFAWGLGIFFFIMSLLGAIDRSEISTAQCAITGGESVYGCLDCCRRRAADDGPQGVAEDGLAAEDGLRRSEDGRRRLYEDCFPSFGYRTTIFGVVKVATLMSCAQRAVFAALLLDFSHVLRPPLESYLALLLPGCRPPPALPAGQRQPKRRAHPCCHD